MWSLVAECFLATCPVLATSPGHEKLVAADLPLINVAEWGFITVARDSVHNVSNNPRWAVSNWADTWIDA